MELTYTSNAIEGNTLSAVETTLVIEKGITIGGKPLKDHLEALDHYDAIRYARELRCPQSAPAGDAAVSARDSGAVRRPAKVCWRRNRALRISTTRGDPGAHGRFRRMACPEPNTPETAFVAHRRLVDIHPFADGNGRTARLLMNLILIRGGYPPVAVHPEDRLEYIRSLQQEQAGQGEESFNALLYRRLDATLGEYLEALQEAQTPAGKPQP